MSRSRREREPDETRVSDNSETASREQPRQDEVAARAYELYQQRGGEHGHDWEDWFAAERELQEEELTS